MTRHPDRISELSREKQKIESKILCLKLERERIKFSLEKEEIPSEEKIAFSPLRSQLKELIPEICYTLQRLSEKQSDEKSKKILFLLQEKVISEDFETLMQCYSKFPILREELNKIGILL